MTIPSPHPLPCRTCISKSLLINEMPEPIPKPTTKLAPRFQEPFRDDYGATAKSFQKLNTFRTLFGFKHLKWNGFLAELASIRAREFTRSKRIRMPYTVGGSKFNIGVPFVDIVVYTAIERENGKMIPVERSLWKVWSTYKRCAEHLVEPIANFAATSVIKNDEMICFSVLISRLSPFLFLPRMQRIHNEQEETQNTDKWDSIIQDIALLSDTLDDLDSEIDEEDKQVQIDASDANTARDGHEQDMDDLIHEVEREAKRVESNTVANSQPVLYEAPLLQPPDETCSTAVLFPELL